MSKTIRWFGFPASPGQLQSNTLKIGYNITGSKSGTAGTWGNAYTLSYSLNGGSTWTNVVAKTNFYAYESGTITVSLSLTQDLTQVQVRELSNANTGDPADSAEMDSTTSSIHIEVTIAPPVISNVAAGGITTSGATITWNTDFNSDSQVDYGTTTAYGQSTTLDPTLVTAHSQGLSGLAAQTLYHHRVKSRDAAGVLAVSGDFTFTTAQSSIPLDGLANLSYDGASNRINTPGFAYDPAGNQTMAVIDASGTQQQYRHDCAGRLAQVLDASGNVLATYSYGAGNRRLMSVEGGVTTYFAWDGGKIIAEYEASGANALVWKKSYVYLGGRLLATTSGANGTETRFHHPDRLGTRLVTDAGGTVVTEQLSMPFGTMLPFTQTYGGENSYQNPTLSNPSKKRFTTYDRSDATGLDYAVNRFYSSQQGRFTQVDPIGMRAVSLDNPQTLNLYGYCANDPINQVDPNGLLWGWVKKLFEIFPTEATGVASQPESSNR